MEKNTIIIVQVMVILVVESQQLDCLNSVKMFLVSSERLHQFELTHAHKYLKLPNSQLELMNSLGLEVKHLHGTQTVQQSTNRTLILYIQEATSANRLSNSGRCNLLQNNTNETFPNFNTVTKQYI